MMVTALEIVMMNVLRMLAKYDPGNVDAVSLMKIETATVCSIAMMDVLMTSPRSNQGCVGVVSLTRIMMPAE